MALWAICVIMALCRVTDMPAQRTDSTHLYKKRQRIAAITGVSAVALTHAGLYQLWYKDYPSSRFHFINDNREWNQMDKCGHAFSAYYLGVAATDVARWTGLSRKKAIWYGGLFGSFFQDPIEILDGFSSGWGASAGDLAANTFGTALCISQNLLWDEQRIWMKYSYSPSPYAAIRPNVLGSGLAQTFLKDYNGQTYWLSANLRALNGHKGKLPAWLNLAIGYGSEGMVGGEDNIWTDAQGILHDRSDIRRYRQYYLSPDIDLSRIKTRHKGLRTFLKIANCLKFPLPAVEYNQVHGLQWHWIKF